jgi:hypothetical protein
MQILNQHLETGAEIPLPLIEALHNAGAFPNGIPDVIINALKNQS